MHENKKRQLDYKPLNPTRGLTCMHCCYVWYHSDFVLDLKGTTGEKWGCRPVMQGL